MVNPFKRFIIYRKDGRRNLFHLDACTSACYDPEIAIQVWLNRAFKSLFLLFTVLKSMGVKLGDVVELFKLAPTVPVVYNIVG